MKKTFNIFMALLFQNGWLVHFSFNNTVKIRSKQLCHCLQCSLKQQCVLMANTRWQPRQTSIPLVSAQMVVIIVSLHSWLLGVWFNAFNLHRGRSLFTTDRSTRSLSKGECVYFKTPSSWVSHSQAHHFGSEGSVASIWFCLNVSAAWSTLRSTPVGSNIIRQMSEFSCCMNGHPRL